MASLSKETDFFILLLEEYAYCRKMNGNELLKVLKEKDMIDYIYAMYGQYHIEALIHAFNDLDEKLGW